MLTIQTNIVGHHNNHIDKHILIDRQICEHKVNAIISMNKQHELDHNCLSFEPFRHYLFCMLINLYLPVDALIYFSPTIVLQNVDYFGQLQMSEFLKIEHQIILQLQSIF